MGRRRKDRINVLDLFCGCGGLSEGFRDEGFTILAASDIWEPAVETYTKNHPDTKMFAGDLRSKKLRGEIIGFFNQHPCDVIVGGPPCQAYSTTGLRDPNDPRGKLFEEYIKIVKDLQPKIFVMENVQGILSIRTERYRLKPEERKKIGQLNKLKEKRISLLLKRRKSKAKSGKETFTQADEEKLAKTIKQIRKKEKEVSQYQEKLVDRIKRRFKNIGYDVDFKVLNAADYGIPQKRQRVFFIGTRCNIPIQFPSKTHSFDTKNEPKLRPWVPVRKVIDDLKDIPEDAEFSHIMTVHSKEFLEKIDQTKIGTSVYEGYTHAFYKLDPDQPSRTVKENHGGVFIHYEKRRFLTPRELARLQSFDDDFKFHGTKRQILTQIGNAVPPKLGSAIAKSISKMLESCKME